MAETRDIPNYIELPDESKVRELAHEILSHAVEGGALYSDKNLWTPETFDVVRSRFIESPNLGDISFVEKLKSQLEGEDDAVRLFAEIITLQLVANSFINQSRKLQNVEEVKRPGFCSYLFLRGLEHAEEVFTRI